MVVLTVTVVVRWGPGLTVPCGTRVARTGKTTADSMSGPVVASQAGSLIAKGPCVSSSGLDPLVVMNLGSSVLAELRAWGDGRRDGPAG
jgi:hypothetical protein